MLIVGKALVFVDFLCAFSKAHSRDRPCCHPSAALSLKIPEFSLYQMLQEGLAARFVCLLRTLYQPVFSSAALRLFEVMHLSALKRFSFSEEVR